MALHSNYYFIRDRGIYLTLFKFLWIVILEFPSPGDEFITPKSFVTGRCEIESSDPVSSTDFDVLYKDCFPIRTDYDHLLLPESCLSREKKVSWFMFSSLLLSMRNP